MPWQNTPPRPVSRTALHVSSSLSVFMASVISSKTFTFMLCLRPVVEGHMMICENVGYDRMRMSLYCLLTCVTQVSMRSPIRCRFLAAAARADAEEMSELALLSGDTEDAFAVEVTPYLGNASSAVRFGQFGV